MFKVKSCYVSLDGKSVFYIADTFYRFKPEQTDKYQFIIEYQDIYREYPELFVLTPDFYRELHSCFGEYKESSYDRYTTFNKVSKLREELKYYKNIKYSQLIHILHPVIFVNSTKTDLLHSVVEALIDKVELKDSCGK